MPPKIIHSIALRPDQVEWLRSHKELNFSAFVQKKLDERIREGVAIKAAH